MLALIIPIFKNEEFLPELLATVADMHNQLEGKLQAVFVIDGSPDNSYEILKKELPNQVFLSKLILLSRNFGSFSAVQAGLKSVEQDYYAVMAADLQEPPELVIKMDKALREEEVDLVVGVRSARNDPLLGRIASSAFWYLYKKLVVSQMPSGGVDVFACNRQFRDALLTLNEHNSSLVAQLFWLGFERKNIEYVRRARKYGKSAWTFNKKLTYLMDSVFAFTDLPIRFLISVGLCGVGLSGFIGLAILLRKIFDNISVPGYAMTTLLIVFFGALNLLSLGILGAYTWRAFENTKLRPNSLVYKELDFKGN